MPSILVVEEIFQASENAAIIERAIADAFLFAYGGSGEGEAYPEEVADPDADAHVLGLEISEASILSPAVVLVLACRS